MKMVSLCNIIWYNVRNHFVNVYKWYIPEKSVVVSRVSTEIPPVWRSSSENKAWCLNSNFD